MAAVGGGEGAMEVEDRLFDLLAGQPPNQPPSLAAPAVWELEGPIITGPMISNNPIIPLLFSFFRHTLV